MSNCHRSRDKLTYYIVGHRDQLRPNHSASGTVQQTSTFSNLKLFYYQTNNCCKLMKNYGKQKKSGTVADLFLIVIFRTGTINKKNLSNSREVNLGVQKSYKYTLTFELSTLPSYILPIC